MPAYRDRRSGVVALPEARPSARRQPTAHRRDARPQHEARRRAGGEGAHRAPSSRRAGQTQEGGADVRGVRAGVHGDLPEARTSPARCRRKSRSCAGIFSRRSGGNASTGFGYAEIQDFAAKTIEKKRSKKTVNNRLTVVRRLLVVAKKQELIEAVPEIEWLKAPKPDFDFLDFDEAARLVAAADAEWTCMILIGLKAGLRQGELLALRWEDIDLVTGLLRVTALGHAWRRDDAEEREGEGRSHSGTRRSRRSRPSGTFGGRSCSATRRGGCQEERVSSIRSGARASKAGCGRSAGTSFGTRSLRTS